MLQRHAVESATQSLDEEVTAGFQAYESVLKARQEMIGSAALLPYHLGRIVTYALLGALAGLGGASLSVVPWLPTLREPVSEFSDAV